MGVRRVVPDLSSTSLEAAKGSYGDLLGLRPVMDHGWIVTLADPGRPGAQISLMTHDATAPVIPDVSVQVDDVDACHAAAVQAGAEIVYPFDPRAVGRSPLLPRDPDGQVINVLSQI
jgi:catechol 2,3-dioxygenase-like lactoylglutathione lyase family enzyme